MIDKEYIKSLNRESLEREAIWFMEQVYSFHKALRDLPEIPDTTTLYMLSTQTKNYSSMDLWEIGKTLQQEHGLDLIPPNFECEQGAGLWKIIRDAIKNPPEPEGLGD